jgi:hypothetical protein
MIAHISLGVRDVERSKRSYDAVLEPLGYKCIRAARKLTGYGYGRDSVAFWVVSAEHPVPADEKSGPSLLLQGVHRGSSRCISRGCAARRRAGQRRARSAARNMALIITLPSSSIRMDTGSRPITVRAKPKLSWRR